MINLLTELTKEFRKVEGKSFHNTNTSNVMKYPYLTYDLSEEGLERNITGFYLDVDLIDTSDSFKGLLSIESDLKAHFKDRRIFTDDLFIRFEYLRSNTINTKEEQLKRRNLQFYCKVDWRNL